MPVVNKPKSNRTNDPQIVVDVKLHEGANSDLLIFSIPLVFFELVCLINVPMEGQTTSKGYVKFKTRHGSFRPRLPREDNDVRQDDSDVEYSNDA